MDGSLKRKLVVGAVALAAVAGAGGAIAADKLGSPRDESKAIIDDAAKQLGVSSSALSSALKKALENRVDAAVADGRLTKEQGDALKARIESSDYPLLFGPLGLGPHPGHFGFANLSVAAEYLGLTEAELRTQLESGKTLAQIAKDRDKSVDGLVNALVDAAKKRLDDAVAAGRLTKDQETQILADVKHRITDVVNGVVPRWFGHRPGFGFGMRRFEPPMRRFDGPAFFGPRV